MTKKEFFNNLHQQIAKKYGISPQAVLCLRSNIIGYKETKEQVLDKHLTLLKTKPIPKQHYKELIDFLTNCSPQDLEITLQLTKFDKQNSQNKIEFE